MIPPCGVLFREIYPERVGAVSRLRLGGGFAAAVSREDMAF